MPPRSYPNNRDDRVLCRKNLEWWKQFTLRSPGGIQLPAIYTSQEKVRFNLCLDINQAFIRFNYRSIRKLADLKRYSIYHMVFQLPKLRQEFPEKCHDDVLSWLLHCAIAIESFSFTFPLLFLDSHKCSYWKIRKFSWSIPSYNFLFSLPPWKALFMYVCLFVFRHNARDRII